MASQQATNEAFDPTVPPPTLDEYQADFQPKVEDINAIHGSRSKEEAKIDGEFIREEETDGLSKHWESPWFECDDLKKYHITNPRVEFPRLARQYANILEVWQKNFEYGRKISQNKDLELPQFARIDQAVNGDLEASVARRRKHLIGTIAYCWQLKQILEEQKEWEQKQSAKRKIKSESKKKKKKEKEKEDKDKKSKKKSKGKGKGKAEEEEKEEDKNDNDDGDEEEEDEDIEPNPYDWGTTSPQKMYNEFAMGLVGVYFLCLCGFSPPSEINMAAYYSKKMDAAHVFANHMAKLVSLTTTDNKPLFQVILSMIGTGATGTQFVFNHHLHSCINFESKHSSQALRDRAQALEFQLTELPPTSTKRLKKLDELVKIDKEIKQSGQLNDQFIRIMKAKAMNMRKDKQSGKYRPYPDHVYLRVYHELGLQANIKQLMEWGITEDDYNRIWRKIDDGEYQNNVRRIICGAVSFQAKNATANDIDHHKLGIGPDYIKKKYQNLLELYNKQRADNQQFNDKVGDLLEQGTDFLDHYGSQQYNTNQHKDDETSGLKEDEINTTMFAHKYLSGDFKGSDDDEQKEQIISNNQSEMPIIIEKKEEKQKQEQEEKKESETLIDIGPKPEEIERIKPLPDHPQKLQQLLRRKERMLIGMTKQYGLKEEEVKKMLELTDGRAVALSPEEFYQFYGAQPIELVNKFMDPNLKEQDKENTSKCLKTLLDSYKRLNAEKLRIMDPAKHYGSLGSAVVAQQQKAAESVHHTKQKFTDDWFNKLHAEFEEYEKRLIQKKENERQQRRQRLDEIKKLERKKRERLTTPIRHNHGSRQSTENALSQQDASKLQSLKEHEEIIERNLQIQKENLETLETNEKILDKFFDAEDRKLQTMNTAEAKEERIRGPDDNNNEYGMDGFLNRESNKNYGNLVAAKQKTAASEIAEQVIDKVGARFQRRRTMSRNIGYSMQQLGVDYAQSATTSPQGQDKYGYQSKSAGAPPIEYRGGYDQRITRLLTNIANTNTISSDLRQEAKSLLTPNHHHHHHHHHDIKSKSPSPLLSKPDEDDDNDHDGLEQSPPQRGHGHIKSSSIIVYGDDHDQTPSHLANDTTIFDPNMLKDITEEAEEHFNDDDDENDDDLKKEVEDSADYYDDDHDVDDDENYQLPFDDIDVMAKDLSWLETDELVPISHKEMLDPEEISKLQVKEMPPYEEIMLDGIEQRDRQSAVDKLEKSFMADAALKKAREKEREEMQKRLEEQKQQQMEAALKQEQMEIDILKQGGIIRQKKTAAEIAAELANLTPEEKAKRRAERKARNNYMKQNRNPQLLEGIDGAVEEETIMVDVEIDDFELVPIEETEDGKELSAAVKNLKEAEEKYGGDIDISSDDNFDDDTISNNGPIIDRRQEKIFNMNTKELYEYIINKTGMNQDTAAKLIDNGVNGAMIEASIIDGELDSVLNDIGFDFSDVAKLQKILQFDGWKTKQSYPVTMNAQNFSKWIEKKVNKKLVEPIINNGIDGKVISLCIEDGDNDLKEILNDAGINDEKQIESLRSQFVLDSQMVPYWNLADVAKWLKTKLKSVKTIDNIISICTNNGINGGRLLSLLHPTPSNKAAQLGIDQVIQSKIRGKINQICRQIDNMDDTEIMFWIHSIPIENNNQIAQQLYQQHINGSILSSQKGNLKKFLKSKLEKSISDHIIERLTAMISQVINENGGFVPNYLIQDPNIMEFNENTASSSSADKGGKKFFASEEERAEYQRAKEKRKQQKIDAKKAKLREAKRRHTRVQSKIELGQAMIFKDGKRFMRVYKGKKIVKQPQRIKNFSKKTITLQKAKNEEQAKIRMARKQKYEKRRREKAELHQRVSGVIAHQLEHGILEANEMIGIKEEDGDFLTDSDGSMTSSEEAMDQELRMTHRSGFSSTRIADRLDFLADASELEEAKHADDDNNNNNNNLNIPQQSQRKGPGRVTMAGHALEDFVGGNDKTLFHRRRASSIVQRIVAKSQNDLANFKMRRGSKRMSRRSISKSIVGLDGALNGINNGASRHSRQFSSGHFVSQFFKSASDRQKIEAGMRGEAPLIVYYCDKDERTEEIRDIFQTSVLDTYIDDYSTFDDYIKILSMRLEQAQKKHRTEMDELRRNKEDLTNEVDALRTKKEELIRLIGQERSLFKRELPSLAKAKQDANAAQDQYEAAEDVIKDKFNETKLHVMMMMQFRDNHLRKLNQDKARNADIKSKIQILQGDIEELLSHYFTLQNAHNKLEHTVALLSELTTLCHEVNVRKKTEYEREIKDLLAMIERYRCRIRNVDRLIEQYQKEVVELRMLHERRSAEFKKIQKNPTTNRTAATIDYYVAQRKLYEQKAEQQNNTFDDFLTVQQKYKKEISQKQSALAHYTKRSQLSDEKFKSGVHRKNQIYKECRELCKSLNISWKQAEKEYIEKGHELAQQFHDQYVAMNQFEQDSKPYGYEFVDAPITTNKNELIQAFDSSIVNKTHDQLIEEEKNLTQGQLDRINPDITDNLDNYQKTIASKTFTLDGGNQKIAQQMAHVHRADPNLDVWRAPGIRNMDEHPDNSLNQTFQAVNNTFYQQHGYEPQILVNIENNYIDEGPSDDDTVDDDDDHGHDNQQQQPILQTQGSAVRSNQSNQSHRPRRRSKKKKKEENIVDQPQPSWNTSTSRSVHFKNQSSLENTELVIDP